MKLKRDAFTEGASNANILWLTTLLLCVIAITSGCSLTDSRVESKEKVSFYSQRQALIDTFSKTDNVFAALEAQIDPTDPESKSYWQWRIDQYMFGQYPEYQPIYNAFKSGKSFSDIYGMAEENLGPKKPLPAILPELPPGYFTDNLQGNPHRGWHYVDGDTVYITYQGQLTDPYIAKYNLVTHQWQGPFKAAESTLSKGERKIDSHGRPVIEMDSEGYLHLIYGGHGGEREDGLNPMSIDTPHAGGRMLHVMSKNPYDISEFHYVDDISPFASYTKSYKMGNGDIYFFTRAGTHKSPWVYYKMKAGTHRFEQPVIITAPTPQLDNPINVDTFYINPLKISDSEIAISYLWHECNFLELHDKTTYARINAYYMRLDTTNDTMYNAQGEQIQLPVTLEVANEKMLAFDSTDKEETPFATVPVVLESGAPALAYEARTKDAREWRLTSFNDGQWTHNLPMPNTVNRSLRNENGEEVIKILEIEELTKEQNNHHALVTYRNRNNHTTFAKATSQNGVNWQVKDVYLSLKNTRIQMEAIRDSSGDAVAVLLNVKQGPSQRLYLWQDGTFRSPQHQPNQSNFSKSTAIIYESFENKGWNAASPRGFTPGLDAALAKNFMFNQLQSEDAFDLETEIVRSGQYAAKLTWHHENPAAYNGDPKKIDNVDRKAMFHGFKTQKVKGAEAWYGFSFFFPKEGTQNEPNEWLFFQIHGSADKRLKEHSRNPPFSLTLSESGMKGNWKWDPYTLSPTRHGDGTSHFKIPGSKADYLDRWVDFVLHVKVDYSDAKTGFLELWVDGKKVLNQHNIQFGYNDDKGIYPSWGLYFNGDLSGMKNEHYLYLDEIRMTDHPDATYEDVAPGQ